MTIPPTHDEEFLALVDRFLDGAASEEEEARLGAWLRASPELAHAFAGRACLTHGVERALAEPAAETKARVGIRPVPAAKTCLGFSLGLLAAGVAMAVGVGLLWPLLQPTDLSRCNDPTSVAGQTDIAPPEKPATPAHVPCRLSNALGVVWESPAVFLGQRLGGRKVTIASGVAELTLDSGVRLLLQGPASLEVTGPNSGRLAYGKVVADVPDGAQGFTLTGPGNKVIDHGTRFAMEVARDGHQTTLGVLSGVVDLQTPDKTVRLFTDYAVEHNLKTIESIPFDRSRFITEFPSAHFNWNLAGATVGQTQTLRFTMPPIMGVPGEVRVLFKYMRGLHALRIHRLRLLHDGRPMAESKEQRIASSGHQSLSTLAMMPVPADVTLSGRWELEMEVGAHWTLGVDGKGPDSPAYSEGIIQVSKGTPSVQAKDFIGRWAYSHNGKNYVREFLADGRMQMYYGGVRVANDANFRWKMVDGNLVAVFHDDSPPEVHALLNHDTLVFLDKNYRDAHRVAGNSGK